jgi:uncharacterized repeat protein (TIGR01451 family)
MLRGVWRKACVAVLVGLFAFGAAGPAFGNVFDWGPDVPLLRPGAHPPNFDEAAEQRLLEFDREFIANRTAGDDRLQVQHAGSLRSRAAFDRRHLSHTRPPAGPATFTGAWTGLGPSPIGEVARSSLSIIPMNGRIAALAIRPSNGQVILGGAQGGIWTYDDATKTWTPRTSDLQTQAIGALAIAPSSDAVIYAGTGEGALSGDSYFGDGILKSIDGGKTWAKVSGDYFSGVSISRLAVDPTNPHHVYAAVLRGRGGARRVTVAPHSRYGLWESTDGAVTWTLRKAASEQNGATDVEIDPQNPRVLYASFWNDAIYKSTNAGRTWSPIMNFGLTAPDFSATRFSLSLSHPTPSGAGTLYAGFTWGDASGDHPARIWKSTDGGANWTLLPDGSGGPQGENDVVADYCAEQCDYDNVIEADPRNPDVIFAAGSFGYDLSPQSGGIYRSSDGGLTWVNLGWDQHPDFHAFAWDATHPGGVVVGSDGGVWSSPDLGGRPTRATPLDANHWNDLNTGGLSLGQFTSIATNPSFPAQARIWGGTQDNGTLRKSATSNTWFDVTSGDGGQVLVDPTDSNFVYGTYFGISPYRITDGGAGFFTNQSITHGINLDDRSEFYVPFVLNKQDPSQLFLGTYRLYRTDNAKAPSAGDVTWKPISPDLTTGCTGTAPNGARLCGLSAIGVGGGDAVYTGSLDGLVYLSTNAQASDTPTWTRVGSPGRLLPNRPVAGIAVDRSNYRTTYLAYNGFDAATPRTPGHVFKTADGGGSWDDITANLPDTPVNSIIVDPSFSNTLYVATDVGPFVTYDGGRHWGPMGTGFPTISSWQIDLDPAHRLMAAGTHGRGAYTLADSVSAPALVLSKADAGVPVGPGSDLTYTLTLSNVGNAPATGVTITDPVPEDTDFVSVTAGGTERRGTVTWSGLTVAPGASAKVGFTVRISQRLGRRVDSIVNDGYRATSAQGPSASGSPTITPMAPPYAVTLAPATQTDGAHTGQSVTYTVTATNQGFRPDSYALSVASAFPATVLDPTCTSPLTTTPTVAPGGSANACVRVTVPAGTPNAQVDTATVTAKSVASPAATATATIKTIAVAVDTLLVDEDTNAPVDSQPIYAAALTSAGVPFSTWDLSADGDLPANYLRAFKNVVWFTGNSYPGPLLPYEARLKAFLDGGGRLLVSGQDILDQAAGTSAFVHDYLHILWDGSETQNDRPTTVVNGVAGTLTAGLTAVPLDHSVLGATFEDRITPINGALTVFTDDSGAPDALSFAGTYKVVFLAFPMEAYGTAAQRADLVGRVVSFFGP